MGAVVVAVIVNGAMTRQTIAGAISTRVDDLNRVLESGTVGATLRFEGIVRRVEPDPSSGGAARDLRALDYQTYDPMAERELERLADKVCEQFGLRSIMALHSRGRVDVGEVSFVLEIASAHRAEAISAMAAFIDRLKQDVPIWKQAVWA